MARQSEQTVPLSVTLMVAVVTYLLGTITISLSIDNLGSAAEVIMAPGIWLAKLFHWGAYWIPLGLLSLLLPLKQARLRKPFLYLGPLALLFALTASVLLHGVLGNTSELLSLMYSKSTVQTVHWILFFLLLIEGASEYLIYTTVYQSKQLFSEDSTPKKPALHKAKPSLKKSTDFMKNLAKTEEPNQIEPEVSPASEKGFPKLHLAFPQLPEVPRLHSPEFIPGVEQRAEEEQFTGDKRVEFMEKRKRKSSPPSVEYVREGEEESLPMPKRPVVTSTIFPAGGVSERAAKEAVNPEAPHNEQPEFTETIAYPRHFADNYIGNRNEELYRQSFQSPNQEQPQTEQPASEPLDDSYWREVAEDIIRTEQQKQVRHHTEKQLAAGNALSGGSSMSGGATLGGGGSTTKGGDTASPSNFTSDEAIAYGEKLFNLTRSKSTIEPVTLDASGSTSASASTNATGATNPIDVVELVGHDHGVTPVEPLSTDSIVDDFNNPTDNERFTPPAVEVIDTQQEPDQEPQFVEPIGSRMVVDEDDDTQQVIDVDASGVTGQPKPTPVVETTAPPTFGDDMLPILSVEGDEETEIPDIDDIFGTSQEDNAENLFEEHIELDDADSFDEEYEDDSDYEDNSDDPENTEYEDNLNDTGDTDYEEDTDDTDDNEEELATIHGVPILPSIKGRKSTGGLGGGSGYGNDLLVEDELSGGLPETLDGALKSADTEQPKIKPANLYEKYRVPAEKLLNPHEDNEYWIIDEETERKGDELVRTLKDFGVEVTLTGIQKGPVVTMFEILPAPGVKVSRIATLQDNIAMELQAAQVRIVAPIPGKKAVGVEVPNADRSLVSFIEMCKHLKEQSKKMAIPVVLGKDITGDAQLIDLTKTPHLLIAGATGSGKSVCVNSLICSILLQRSPREVKIIMIDPKRVELGIYNDIPHMLTPVITDSKKALKAIQYGIFEMERRYSLLESIGGRNIREFNNKVEKEQLATEKLSHLVIIVDEFADLMTTTGRELEDSIARLAAMARAVGIHMVLATQRPSREVITGLIKANIPSRVAFMVTSNTDSRIIIDESGAEKLLGQGDMLFTSSWNPYPIRMQGVFLSEDEVEQICAHVKSLGEPEYLDESIFEDEDEDTTVKDIGDEDVEDPLMIKALEIVVERKGASASYLQRRLKIGYNRAARLVEQMEEYGIIGPPNGSKPRELIGIPQEFLDQMG